MNDEYNKEYLEKSFKSVLYLEWLGVRIENTKKEKDNFGFESKIIYYYSVPESSTIEVKDAKLNNKIKTSDGLKIVAKETLTDIVINSCRVAFSDDEDEFLEDVKNNISDYVKFYAKVRNGEIWNEELGNNRVKELCEEIQKASGYKEV